MIPFILGHDMKSEEYSFVYYNQSYTQEQRDFIVQKAKEIAKRSKYFNENFSFYDFSFWNKAVFLEENKFRDKNLLEKLNFNFVYYCWFVNICLYQEYGDDLEEFKHDCYLRNEIEKLCEELSEDEILYLQKELFYLDLVYCVLTDTKKKLQVKDIDNNDWKNEEIDGRKEQFWHVLYYPVNLIVPIHKDFV